MIKSYEEMISCINKACINKWEVVTWSLFSEFKVHSSVYKLSSITKLAVQFFLKVRNPRWFGKLKNKILGWQFFRVLGDNISWRCQESWSHCLTKITVLGVIIFWFWPLSHSLGLCFLPFLKLAMASPTHLP